jgi:hypothetical protein
MQLQFRAGVKRRFESHPIALQSPLSHRQASARPIYRNALKSPTGGYTDPSEERSTPGAREASMTDQAKPVPRPWRSYLRFSVRGMIVVVLLVRVNWWHE